MSSNDHPESIRENDHVQWQLLKSILALPNELLKIIADYDKGASVICISDTSEISGRFSEQLVHLPDEMGKFNPSKTLSSLQVVQNDCYPF